MVRIIGHFDGNAIIPDEPVDLPRNVPLRVTVEAHDTDFDPEQLKAALLRRRDESRRLNADWLEADREVWESPKDQQE